MKPTNSLGSHHPESNTRPFNQMGSNFGKKKKNKPKRGDGYGVPEGKSKRVLKTIYKRKMRMALKNPLFFEKIV